MVTLLKNRSRRKRMKTWTGFLFSFLLGVFLTAGVFLYVGPYKIFPPGSLPSKRMLTDKAASKPSPDANIREKEAPLEEPSTEPLPRVAIVIDDLGGERHVSQELFDMNVDLTFSILPFTSHARSIAEAAHRKGREVILHLPMEPHGYPKANPGEGTLFHAMDKGKLLRQLSRDIEAVPHVRGVSNHMGSRLMEDPEKMKTILSDLKRRGLFFLDSRTTPQTVGFKVARSLGLRAAEKTLFLDHSQDEKDIKEKIEELIRFSLSSGKAVGIGHPHPSTIKSLKEMLPKIREKGIEIVPLSSLTE
jgi:uncharacterized protein